MSSAMDKIKDTLHLSNDHPQTHTTSNNLYSDANQTKNPPRDHGLEYIGTGANVDHGYSTRTRGNSGDDPRFVDKVKDALHLNKDNKDNQKNHRTGHNATYSEYTPSTQKEISPNIANSARRQDLGETGTHQNTSYIPTGSDSSYTSHLPTDPSMGYYTTHTNLENSSDHYSPQSDPRSHGVHDTGPFGSVHDSSARNPSTVPGTAQRNVGPHRSDLANRLDPRVDYNSDNSMTIGGNNTRS